MDFNVKKLVKDAGSAISRVVQVGVDLKRRIFWNVDERCAGNDSDSVYRNLMTFRVLDSRLSDRCNPNLVDIYF